MTLPRDLKMVIESMQDMAASKELTRMADQMAGDFPEAARELHERASHLQRQVNHRRTRTHEIQKAVLLAS